MNTQYAVELAQVDKIFRTRHLFMKDEETEKRKLYTKKVVHAVNNVEIGIAPGEILGLLGPNGAGKTTCVKMISGLVRPSSGKVFVQGMHVEKKRLKVLREVGVVLEGTRTVIWPLTPIENLNYFGNLRDVRGKILKQRAHELLEFIGLKQKKYTQVRRLSRGQRQRLAICIALVTDPSVLLLDEPTTGLDVQSSRAIREKVKEMAREMGKSVLVTTHDMHVAQRLCDRIGIIHKGELIACKKTDELLDVFSDQTYEIRLNRDPDMDAFTRIPGVLDARMDGSEASDGRVFMVQVTEDEEERSRALYATVKELEGQGLRLFSITQRQQTLENVFLRLTGHSV